MASLAKMPATSSTSTGNVTKVSIKIAQKSLPPQTGTSNSKTIINYLPHVNHTHSDESDDDEDEQDEKDFCCVCNRLSPPVNSISLKITNWADRKLGSGKIYNHCLHTGTCVPSLRLGERKCQFFCPHCM